MKEYYGGREQDKAGEIATDVLRRVRTKVVPGVPLVDIADWVEQEIAALGGSPAFPCSVAVNEYAAHYSPLLDDPATVPPNSIVKIDLGVHINGYVADCATTINFNESLAYLERASRKALKEGIQAIRPGATISEIGKAIHLPIRNAGATPVFNLSGHLMSQYVVHAGLSILNHENPSTAKIEEGMVLAIEPFASTGDGYVHNHGPTGIYSITSLRNTRSPTARRILNEMYTQRRTLPFAKRWLRKIEPSSFILESALAELGRLGLIESYPPLREHPGAMVSQHECTVVVEKSGARIICGEV